jgi:hypothetical protein
MELEMNDSHTIKEFKYLSTNLDSLSFPSVHRIGDRARAALNEIDPKIVTEEEVLVIRNDMEFMLENYFSEEKYRVIEEIKEAGRYDLLESDDKGRIWELRSHADEDFSWNNEENTSQCYALMCALEQFHDAKSDYPKFKYFAVLALINIKHWWSLDNFEWTSEGEQKPRTSPLGAREYRLIIEVLVDAMEAACNITSLLLQQWRDESYTDEKNEQLRAQLQDNEKKVEAKVEERARALIQQQQKKSNEKLNQARWALRNEITDWLCDDWFPRRADFKSQSDAAEYYFGQIAEKFGKRYARRTIISWISECGKKKGVRF